MWCLIFFTGMYSVMVCRRDPESTQLYYREIREEVPVHVEHNELVQYVVETITYSYANLSQ